MNSMVSNFSKDLTTEEFLNQVEIFSIDIEQDFQDIEKLNNQVDNRYQMIEQGSAEIEKWSREVNTVASVLSKEGINLSRNVLSETERKERQLKTRQQIESVLADLDNVLPQPNVVEEQKIRPKSLRRKLR
ncbi:hypothetical protein MA785_000825 [Vibrio parahaemolyticus]|nr:hypothetical protein [Vibrio parahaemolyticus]EJR2787934.1 hypothetical protein [Vibrio parahaemolyticus]